MGRIEKARELRARIDALTCAAKMQIKIDNLSEDQLEDVRAIFTEEELPRKEIQVDDVKKIEN